MMMHKEVTARHKVIMKDLQQRKSKLDGEWNLFDEYLGEKDEADAFLLEWLDLLPGKNIDV